MVSPNLHIIPCIIIRTTVLLAVCFSSDKLKILEEYAKSNGLLNYSQVLEHLIENTQKIRSLLLPLIRYRRPVK
jgi:hypothetical protein